MRSTPRLVLHVGAMKTGTTYLQNVLQANGPALRDAGWSVPGQDDVVRATRQLLDVAGPAVELGGARPDVAASPRWTALLDDARVHGARGGRGTVVSMEFLSFLRAGGVQAVVAGAEGLEVHVVLTVRDAVRALPSQWQSLTRNAFGHSWPDFATSVRTVMQGEPDPVARPFLRTQRIPRMVTAWATSVPRERFTVVTVPDASAGLPRDLVWRRLCDVLDVDPATTSTAASFDNPQLGYGSCELLRRVNVELAMPAERPYRKVMRRLSHEHLLPLRAQQGRHRLDQATARLAVRLNRRTLAAVAEHATLVGDPADLPGDLDGRHDLDPGDRPVDPPATEVRDAAEALWRGGRELCAELGLALRPELAAELPDATPDAVRQVAGVVAVAITGDESHRLPTRAANGPTVTAT
ncbi:hypothetical protein ABFT23_20985 [Nocardioides sp. C4-1]|uniref:hypothetical protein n=1 Tax=Nocardioides sp. C4-1 TaxID=3151851 RepID=UPI003264B75A